MRTANIRAFLTEAKRISNSYLFKIAMTARLLKKSLENLKTIRAEILKSTKLLTESLIKKKMLK